MKKITIILMTALVTMVAMAQEKIEMTLNEGWQFSRDNINWQEVTVPHDWAISGPFDKKWDLQVVAYREVRPLWRAALDWQGLLQDYVHRTPGLQARSTCV